MAVEEYIVAFEVQDSGSQFVAPGTAFLKGETINQPEVSNVPAYGNGPLQAKLVAVKAESKAEACKVASLAYGNRSGLAGAALKTNWEFTSN